jgi:pimeloyl-ACP methyl ester carboxylesterase
MQRLLTVMDLRAPYVVVGHSIGALIALIYAARWPENVAGLVLVDPSDIQLNLDVEEQELVLEDGEQASFDVLATVPEVAAGRRRLGLASVVISSRVGRWLEVEDIEPWRPYTLEMMDERWQRAHQDLADDLGAARLIADVGDHYVQNDQPELVARAIRSVAQSGWDQP